MDRWQLIQAKKDSDLRTGQHLSANSHHDIYEVRGEWIAVSLYNPVSNDSYYLLTDNANCNHNYY